MRAKGGNIVNKGELKILTRGREIEGPQESWQGIDDNGLKQNLLNIFFSFLMK